MSIKFVINNNKPFYEESQLLLLPNFESGMTRNLKAGTQIVLVLLCCQILRLTLILSFMLSIIKKWI